MRRNFYGLRGALHFAGKALYAVVFSGRVRFLFAKRVPRRFSPIIQRNGANIDAYAVSNAAIPIHRAGGSVNSQLLRGINGSPNFVSVMFADNLAFCLKIRVNRQKISPIKSRKPPNIRVSLAWFCIKPFWSVAHLFSGVYGSVLFARWDEIRHS